MIGSNQWTSTNKPRLGKNTRSTAQPRHAVSFANCLQLGYR